MYRTVPAQVGLPALDHRVLQFRRDGQVFARSRYWAPRCRFGAASRAT